jgi:hypothetical protein
MVKIFDQYPTAFYKAIAELSESKKELIRSQIHKDGLSKAQIAGLKPQTCLILVKLIITRALHTIEAPTPTHRAYCLSGIPTHTSSVDHFKNPGGVWLP